MTVFTPMFWTGCLGGKTSLTPHIGLQEADGVLGPVSSEDPLRARPVDLCSKSKVDPDGT